MQPFYKWTLRLWFFDIQWKRQGFWRLDVEYLSRRIFVGKRELAFFKEHERVF